MADNKLQTMRAVQWDPTTQEIIVRDIPIPTPQDGQFLVKMKSASLCHSDLMLSLRPPASVSARPVTMGHEGVGHIIDMTPAARDRGFDIGDPVGFLYFQGCCTECEACQVHNVFCATGNQRVVGFQVDGYFAEYSVVDWRMAIKLPTELAGQIERCAPLFCAGITAFHAVDGCELDPGQWFVAVGCGGLGQFAIQYAKAMGYKVIGLDIQDETLAAAKQLGADITYNTATDPKYVDKLKAATAGGAHAAAVFTDADAAYAAAPAVLRLNGLLMIVGLADKPLTLSTQALSIGMFRVKGESIRVPQKMPKVIDFVAKHQIFPPD